MFEYFEHLSFSYEGEKQGADYWTGALQFCFLENQIDLKMAISVDDWDFTTLPHIYLTASLPKFIKKIFPLPHLDISEIKIFGNLFYGFCYSLPDRNELPRLNPTAIIEYALLQTQKVLSDLISSELIRQKELYRELEPTWLQLFEHQKNTPEVCSRYLLVEQKQEHIYFERHENEEQVIPCVFLKISSKNIPPIRDLLPLKHFQGNWYSLCAWLDRWKKDASTEVKLLIKNNFDYIKDSKVLSLVIICENSILPIYFIMSNGSSCLSLLTSSNKTSSGLRNLIFYFGKPGIYLESNHIYHRNLLNLNQPTLENKKIVIIGCGAIGGYLALSLAKLGAGSNDALLTLIDPDLIEAHNIGRHLLGKNSIKAPKSYALKKILCEQFPSLRVVAFFGSVFSNKVNLYEILIESDLIIDATGKIEVAETLNERWQFIKSKKKSTLLHAWITSNGECVQGLLVPPNTNAACRSCLRQAGSQDYRDNSQNPLKDKTETIYAFRACSDYTPYSVSASQSASALVTDMVLDWLIGHPEPLYRTRYNERWNGVKIESSSPEKNLECPYCAEILNEI